MLEPATSIRKHVFSYLATKAGPIPSLPAYPHDSLIAWSLKRYDAVTDPKIIYGLVARDLLISQQLTSQKTLPTIRLGMRLASYTTIPVVGTLHDAPLAARIEEGWLFPLLSSGYDKPGSALSQERIVEDLCAAYAADGEVDKRNAGLRMLLHVPCAENTQDWARDQLAQAMAAKGNYTEAIAYLKAIHSNTMQIKNMIPEYEKDLAKQQHEKDLTKQRPLPVAAKEAQSARQGPDKK